MTFLYYFPSVQLAISDNSANFPSSMESFEQELTLNIAIKSDDDLISLNEWNLYYLKFYAEKIHPSIPKLFHQDQFDGSYIIEKIGGIYKINFQNYVGLSKIGPVKIEVVNRKIKQQQYQSLLSYITEHYIDLVYQFSRNSNQEQSTTGFSTSRDKVGDNIDFVNFLFLKERLLSPDNIKPTIQEIVQLILNEPHYKIESDALYSPTELVANIDPGYLMQAISSGNNLQRIPAEHGLAYSSLAVKLKALSLTNSAYFPINMKEVKKHHCFDTAENRFVKYFLESILEILGQLKKQLQLSEKTYFNPDVEQTIEQIYGPIKFCLEDPLWREVAQMRLIPTNSTVLQRKESYRQLFSLYSFLQLASRYDFDCFDFHRLLESKDTNLLYEYWCFFMVKEILEQEFGAAENVTRLINESSHQTNQQLTEGIYLRFSNDLRLGFNITFPGRASSYSQEFRPDIVLEFRGKHLILDAKNKLHNWDESSGTPKTEDINKMHTYRDAIINTVGAFILYPGEKSVFYRFHGATHDVEGVGAISLIPDLHQSGKAMNTVKLKELITEFLGDTDV